MGGRGMRGGHMALLRASECAKMRAMGFTTIATTAAAVAPKVFEAAAAFSQEKGLKRAAAEQERVSAQQADAIEAVASSNQMRGSRNAAAELGHARADAAASNTAQDGSTYGRGVDLATRLQDEIKANANEQLQRANHVRMQGELDAWDLRNQAKQSRLQGFGAVASGVGSLFSGLAKGMGGSKKKAKADGK